VYLNQKYFYVRPSLLWSVTLFVKILAISKGEVQPQWLPKYAPWQARKSYTAQFKPLMRTVLFLTSLQKRCSSKWRNSRTQNLDHQQNLDHTTTMKNVIKISSKLILQSCRQADKRTCVKCSLFTPAEVCSVWDRIQLWSSRRPFENNTVNSEYKSTDFCDPMENLIHWYLQLICCFDAENKTDAR